VNLNVPISTTNGSEQCYITYADDDMDDQAFLVEMMRKVNPDILIKNFLNGLELVQFLEQLPKNALLPSCIVLDLNMPVWDGMHTLKVLKGHPAYKAIPAFIFSTSSSERDIAMAELLDAEAYISKPYGQKELFAVCQEFSEYCNLELRRKNQPLQRSK
jgi:CheY-like chemotaxis protein